MAEHDPTPEQLAAIAAENETAEMVNYRAPAQKSLQEIHELDRNDESLRKYKEALLGSESVPEGRIVACVCTCTSVLVVPCASVSLSCCTLLIPGQIFVLPRPHPVRCQLLLFCSFSISDCPQLV